MKTYEIRRFDVWGNSRDGYDINDSYVSGEIDIETTPKIFNRDLPEEFWTDEPTDRQVFQALKDYGEIVKHCQFRWVTIDCNAEGEFFVTQAKNDFPLVALAPEGAFDA